MMLESIDARKSPAENASVHRNPYKPADPREIIESLRIKCGYRSVRSLAIAAGVQQPGLHRYLKGKQDSIEVSTLRALAEVLHVTVSQLLDGKRGLRRACLL